MDRAHGLLACAAVALLLAGCLGPGTTRPTRLFVLNATATPPATGVEAPIPDPLVNSARGGEAPEPGRAHGGGDRPRADQGGRGTALAGRSMR